MLSIYLYFLFSSTELDYHPYRKTYFLILSNKNILKKFCSFNYRCTVKKTVSFASVFSETSGTNKVRAARISETHSDGGVMMAEAPGFGGSVRDFPKAFWIIIRNPVFVCITASACCQSIVVNGVSAFMAKFLENEFLLATGRAAELTGKLEIKCQ